VVQKLQFRTNIQNQNFGQNQNFWAKSNFGQNQNFWAKSKFWSKISVSVKNLNFGQKSKFWLKI